MKKALFIIGSILVPVGTVFALSYNDDNLPYPDAPRNLETRVALSLLTDLEVIRGNDDGTFAPNRTLNRAEFITIVMRLRPQTDPAVQYNCFPDVPSSAWYADAVCTAKAIGIVQGENGYFSPDRPINYVEAVKVLVELYGLPVVPTGVWYEGYLTTATEANVLTEGLPPGAAITRAQMARITASFVAYNEGELTEFRAAQQGVVLSSSSSSSMMSSVSSVSSEQSSSTSSYTYDTHGSVELADNIILLGKVSPVVTSVKIFSDSQPVFLTDITISLNSDADSVESLLLYDETGRYLGRATLRSSASYTLSMRTLDIEIPHRENYTVYARAQLKPYNAGGVSGETVEVSSVRIDAIGSWNNQTVSQSSTEDFPIFQTARSRITEIRNAGATSGLLVAGSSQLVGEFGFTGEASDGQADVAVRDVVFQIESAGGVSVSNVFLSADGTSETYSCNIISSTIVCSNIPASFGSMEDRPRTLQVYADVTVPATSQTQFLRLSLNQAGSIGSSGAVAWTDGSTSFVWVPLGSPLARGTYFE